ncbi:MAG TPA: shikimate dehydrogenase [Acetobacteraceae bacterium]|nr:shikimate dehydrogenase [Acetobacteraceae bacterium]
MTNPALNTTLLLGLIGAGIQASRAPALHEREGEAQGFRTIYRLIDLEQLGLGPEALPKLLSAAEWMGFSGLNITHPCKQTVLPLLHEVSPDAAAIGAVNTVLLRDGKRIGHNTDCWGFVENFRRGLPGARLEHVVQLGAGGAGAAVARGALLSGVRRLTIFDIEVERARQLAIRFNSQFGEARAEAGFDLARAMAAADGVINTTPVGMAGHPGLPLPAALLRPALWVAEIIYFPLETALLRTARDIGCRTLDGGGMAVFQAVRAFHLFSGVVPDAARMRHHFQATGAATLSA